MVFMVKKLPAANFILRGKSEKYTKENMLVERFGSHFSQNGPLNVADMGVCGKNIQNVAIWSRN